MINFEGIDNMRSGKLLLLAIMAAIMAMPETGFSSSKKDQGRQALEDAICDVTGPETDARYISSYIDLNGDRRKEAVVYLIGPETCGSGGCPTLVFSPEGQSYKLLTFIEITRPPILAAKSKTRGWRDLIVFVSGGGTLVGYSALLPFDGTSYPESPFLDPARPLKGRARGDLLIKRTRYDDARPLSSCDVVLP